MKVILLVKFYNKSINNIKSLNFFKKLNLKFNNDENNTKSIDIFVEEKPTGEIYAAAGAGTSGASFGFGVKENNFLGKGIGLDTNFNFSRSFKGNFLLQILILKILINLYFMLKL